MIYWDISFKTNRVFSQMVCDVITDFDLSCLDSLVTEMTHASAGFGSGDMLRVDSLCISLSLFQFLLFRLLISGYHAISSSLTSTCLPFNLSLQCRLPVWRYESTRYFWKLRHGLPYLVSSLHGWQLERHHEGTKLHSNDCLSLQHVRHRKITTAAYLTFVIKVLAETKRLPHSSHPTLHSGGAMLMKSEMCLLSTRVQFSQLIGRASHCTHKTLIPPEHKSGNGSFECSFPYLGYKKNSTGVCWVWTAAVTLDEGGMDDSGPWKKSRSQMPQILQINHIIIDFSLLPTREVDLLWFSEKQVRLSDN